MRRHVLLAVGLFALSLSAAFAEDVPLADRTLEARAQSLFSELRCIVCEGQPLAGSRAEISVEMRNNIRSQLQKGMEDAAILSYYAARYGDTILMNPPKRSSTAFLWLAPLLFAVWGALALMRYQRKSRADAASSSTPSA